MLKPKLHHVLPGPMFQDVETDPRSYWEIVIRDAMSDDRVHFECTRNIAKFTVRDLAIAGARECQDGAGLVSVRRFDRGLPISFQIFRVRYAWNDWQIQEVKPC